MKFGVHFAIVLRDPGDFPRPGDSRAEFADPPDGRAGVRGDRCARTCACANARASRRVDQAGVTGLRALPPVRRFAGVRDLLPAISSIPSENVP
jgi:hypothetical protein